LQSHDNVWGELLLLLLQLLLLLLRCCSVLGVVLKPVLPVAPVTALRLPVKEDE
jgi:hypothetical protein